MKRSLSHSVAHARPQKHQSVRQGLPDFAYIKKKIPILAVAEKLGIRSAGILRGATWTTAHCFRPENHKNGDRTPSLNFNTKKNRFMCFACDEGLGSNLDLVMEYEQTDVHRAANWIDQHFPGIPRLEKKSFLADQEWEFRAGVDEITSLEHLVRSGLLATLKASERSVLIVLWSFRDGNDVAEISYFTIMARTGIRGRATVARAIKQFERIGLMRVERGWERGTGRRAPNRYIFTFDAPKLLEQLTRKSPR